MILRWSFPALAGASGEARAVLRLLALRGFVSARTSLLTAEWSETVERVAHEEKRWRNENWRAWLDWLNHASVCFEEIPIRVTVRRDPKDDPSSCRRSLPARILLWRMIPTCWTWRSHTELPA